MQTAGKMNKNLQEQKAKQYIQAKAPYYREIQYW